MKNYFRAEEKKILDSVMGPKVYDSRIRPAGINGTGTDDTVKSLKHRDPKIFFNNTEAEIGNNVFQDPL